MALFGLFGGGGPSAAERAAAQARQAEIADSLRRGRTPAIAQARLADARAGRGPWTATLTPAELLIMRSHGVRPIGAVSSTCWLHYGWSWTEGHEAGWDIALRRLQNEAADAGANAVVDVRMRTVPLAVENSMDFSLVGTAIVVAGLPPADRPVVATVPALEFVKLLEADVVPTGIGVGAYFEWLDDWRGAARQVWGGNVESRVLSQFWERVRRQAHAGLRAQGAAQGNGLLAHVNFSQMFEFEGGQNQPRRYLGRHIVVATTVDARRGAPFPHEIGIAVDMCAGASPLARTRPHHQSYASADALGEKEGPI